MPTRPATVLLEPTGENPCQGSRPSVDMNKLCGPRQVCPWASVSPSVNQAPPQDEKDGQGSESIQWALLTTGQWIHLARLAERVPGHYHSPGRAPLASCAQLFPAPSLVSLALVPRGVGAQQGPSAPKGTKPSGRSWPERGSRPSRLWSPRKPQ